METDVTVGEARLLQGDCVELMAELEPCSVDAVITDPPYMIGAISTGDKWCATEDGSQGKGTGRHIACFVLTPNA